MVISEKAGEYLNILFITTKVPFPPDSGGKIATFYPIRELSRLGHNVRLISIHDSSPLNQGPLKEICDLRLVNLDTRTRVAGMIKNLPSRIPYTVSKYQSPLVGKAIEEAAAAKRFDVAHLEMLHVASYGPMIRKKFGVPIVLREQNVESQLQARFAEVAGAPLKWYLKLQARRAARYEAAMAKQFDLCMMISEEDHKTLESMAPGIRARVVPAGVDVESLKPLETAKEPGKIIFLGTMSWPPNVDAAHWFVNEILPMIIARSPETCFYIVGADPPKSVKDLNDGKRVVVTGYVDDIREHVCSSRVFVVPLRAGGGMRLKILEAMALGVPVVSTSLGMEGIDAEDGKEILRADAPGDIAAAVISLLRDQDKARAMTAAAAQLVKDKYSWSGITRQFMVPAYERAIQNADMGTNKI